MELPTLIIRPQVTKAILDSQHIVGVDHVKSALALFQQVQWHQHMAFSIAVQGFNAFSGHIIPESLPAEDKRKVKDSNLVLRDYMSFLLMACVGDVRDHTLLWQTLKEYGNADFESQQMQSLVKIMRSIQQQPPEYIAPQAARQRRKRLNRKKRREGTAARGNPQSPDFGTGTIDFIGLESDTSTSDFLLQQTYLPVVETAAREGDMDEEPQDESEADERSQSGRAEADKDMEKDVEDKWWRKDDESPDEHRGRVGVDVKNGFLHFNVTDAASDAKGCKTEPGRYRRPVPAPPVVLASEAGESAQWHYEPDIQTVDTGSCSAADSTFDEFDIDMCRQATDMLLQKLPACPRHKLPGLTSRLSRELQALPARHELKKKTINKLHPKILATDFLASDEMLKILHSVLRDLCEMSGPEFPQLQLAWGQKECQAKVWAEFLESLDGQKRFHELDECLKDVLTSTMSMLNGLDGPSFKKMFAPVFQALQKLICGGYGVSEVDDEFVVQTGQWLLDQMHRAFNEGLTANDCFTIKEKGIRSFCALFRYKFNTELFGVGLGTWNRDETDSHTSALGVGRRLLASAARNMDAMRQHSSDMDAHYFADMSRIFVYTHAFEDVLRLVDSCDRGGKDRKLFLVLNEIKKCLTPMASALVQHGDYNEPKGSWHEGIWTTKAKAALTQILSTPAAGVKRTKVALPRLAAWLHELEATEWRQAAIVLTILFGEGMMSELACCREIHEDFVAESKLFYDVCRGLQDASRLMPCAWHVRLQVTRNMTQLADSLELRGRPRSGHPSSWSAWISTLGEFLAGNAAQDGTFSCDSLPGDGLHIRQVEGKIERVLEAFAEDGKLQQMMWGSFWNEAFWSVQLFFQGADLPEVWRERLATYARQLEAYIDEEVGEHRKALEQVQWLVHANQNP